MALTTNEKWNYGVALGAMGAILDGARTSLHPDASLIRLVGCFDRSSRPLVSAAS